VSGGGGFADGLLVGAEGGEAEAGLEEVIEAWRGRGRVGVSGGVGVSRSVSVGVSVSVSRVPHHSFASAFASAYASAYAFAFAFAS
jgi:hypothetical protein